MFVWVPWVDVAAMSLLAASDRELSREDLGAAIGSDRDSCGGETGGCRGVVWLERHDASHERRDAGDGGAGARDSGATLRRHERCRLQCAHHGRNVRHLLRDGAVGGNVVCACAEVAPRERAGERSHRPGRAHDCGLGEKRANSRATHRGGGWVSWKGVSISGERSTRRPPPARTTRSLWKALRSYLSNSIFRDNVVLPVLSR